MEGCSILYRVAREDLPRKWRLSRDLAKTRKRAMHVAEGK